MSKKIKGYIKRKSMLYVTGVEYGDYTMNHVLGCAHGCKYPCYAYVMKKRFGQMKSYDSWLEPYLVENTLELLDKEIPKLKGKIKSVQLCFTTDPFMYGYDEIAEMSINAIKKLNDNGIKCCVLTKGVLPIELSELSDKNEYGITLVSMDERFREKMEPFAARLVDRLDSLLALHNKGCKTWISMEPYPTPNIINQNLNDILENIKFTDKIIFGKMNYNSIVTEYNEHKYFYNDCVTQVSKFCETNNIQYYIKSKTVTHK